METCIFCRIIRRDTPASVVFEDEEILAFMDIQPVNPGHVLVIPKRHWASLSDIAPEAFARVSAVSQKVAAALRRSGIRCEAVNLILADGEAAGQEVFHLHMHVIPRFAGDGFGFQFNPGYAQLPERRELDECARRIHSAMTSIPRP
ncbi:MAG: HIT family protein [Anaerolineales bacterium]|nr:HIT family protein [Anaerolineales bacterium]